MTWGENRCYTVRTVETIGGFTIESDAPEPRVRGRWPTRSRRRRRKVSPGIPSEGAINLIWEANPEKDLAGYIVLRAAPPSEQFEPITPAPIQETLVQGRSAARRVVRLRREGRGQRRQRQPGVGARDRDRALNTNVVARLQADRDGPA